MFVIEDVHNWLEQRTAELRQEGLTFELSSHSEQRLEKLGVRFQSADRLASFTAWPTGDCDWDIMDATPARFVENSWGLRLTDETYKEVFEQFVVSASGSR